MIKISFAIAAITVVCITVWVPKSRNNVCKTFGDYYSNRDANKNCYYNPDLDLSVPEIVQRRGYPIETYEVLTQDGYILTVFRLPHGKALNKQVGKPVYLQHGANSNSGCFVNVGDKSLAFILADAGYDVWIGNFRGTIYSPNHLHLNQSTDPEYWNFSFHEYGAYDLNAIMSLVHGKTNEKIVYIGYSLGTSAMYVYSATYPYIVHNQIKFFINLAPCVFFGEESYTLVKFAALIWKLLEPLLKSIANSVVSTAFVLPNEVLRYVCLPLPIQMKFCMMPHVTVLGSGYQHLDPETLPITLIHNNDKTSLKVWIHITQMWNNNVFAQYDYGHEMNLKLYGSSSPLEYNLTNIKVPTYFIRASSDLLNTKKDVEKLYGALPENVKPIEIYVVEEENFGHIELLNSKDVVTLVHDKIVNVIKAVT